MTLVKTCPPTTVAYRYTKAKHRCLPAKGRASASPTSSTKQQQQQRALLGLEACTPICLTEIVGLKPGYRALVAASDIQAGETVQRQIRNFHHCFQSKACCCCSSDIIESVSTDSAKQSFLTDWETAEILASQQQANGILQRLSAAALLCECQLLLLQAGTTVEQDQELLQALMQQQQQGRALTAAANDVYVKYPSAIAILP